MTVYAAPGTEGSIVTYRSRYENWIGGEWVPPVKGQYFENPSPVTGKTFCEVAALAPPRTSSWRSTPRTRPRRPGARPRPPSAPTS